MVLSALALICMTSPLHIDTGTYNFKNAKVRYVIQTRWQDLRKLYPGIVLTQDKVNPPSTGSWLYVDEKANSVVFGSRDDTWRQIAEMLEVFDIKVARLQIGLKLDRPDWGLSDSAVIETSNNESVTFVSGQIGVSVTAKPRVQPDGSVSVLVTVAGTGSNQQMSCVSRLNAKNPALEIVGGVATLTSDTQSKTEIATEQVGAKPWEPYVIRVTAHVLESKG